MNNPRLRSRFMCTGLICVAALGSAKAMGELVSAELRIEHAWQPQMPSVVPVRAGYLTVLNQADHVLEVVDVTSTEFESVEIHRSVLRQDSVTMEPVAKLSLAPGETVRFAPHGLHLMLRNARVNHAVGDYYPVVLHLSDGRNFTVDMHVVTPGCEHCGNGSGAGHADHHHHDH